MFRPILSCIFFFFFFFFFFTPCLVSFVSWSCDESTAANSCATSQKNRCPYIFLFLFRYRSVPTAVFDYVAEEYAQRVAADGEVTDGDVMDIAEEAIREKLGRRNVIRELSQGVCNLGNELERMRAAEIADLSAGANVELRRVYRSECQRDRSVTLLQ